MKYLKSQISRPLLAGRLERNVRPHGYSAITMITAEAGSLSER